MLNDDTRISLPGRPRELGDRAAAAWREPVQIETYRPLPADRFPAYLHRRVYQGSSGRVYPLPFHDRISSERTRDTWDAVHLENPWLRVMILPALGGRIHLAMDRTNDYDVFYRNDVIKPALVGLAGPWIAGGVEFNWPQHHRPATYLPTDVSIEEHPDGAVTVWCGDHDPFARMKGMHGVTLHPDRAVLELRVRLYNRSELPQTFLWWANVAARAHEQYQSFFPPDVRVVADHARRAVTGFPAADAPYYGIDYKARHDHTWTSKDGQVVAGDRLDWYRNITVPTSYMCVGSRGSFFGGYDHGAAAGFVHVADRRIATGKKQWTWGDAPFGHAWDRNLSDDASAYVELMAGVFTDNQPDFSHLAPGETKVFTQHWFPIQQIGPARAATVEAALALSRTSSCADGATTGPAADLGVCVTAVRPATTVEVRGREGALLWRRTVDLAPGAPLRATVPLPADDAELDSLSVRVTAGDTTLVTCGPEDLIATPDVIVAQEPEAPEAVASVEELYLIGRHLEQYRHATRSPEIYWREALRRDPHHAASHTALGERAYRHGRYEDARAHLTAAVERLTRLNANPLDASAYYLLGLALRRLQRDDEASEVLGRALWSRAHRAPAGYELARIDAARHQDAAALDRLGDVLRVEPEHLQARALRALVLRRLGREDEARTQLAASLALDRLDWWARDLSGLDLECDAQTCLDVALEYAAVGQEADALRVLGTAARREADRAAGAPAAGPLIAYHAARVLERLGEAGAAHDEIVRAGTLPVDYCFPSRLDDVDALTAALRRVGAAGPAPRPASMRGTIAARPAALLGHWLYAHDRPRDAVASWQTAIDHDPHDAVVWRNLGLAAVNDGDDIAAGRAAYARATAEAPDEARLWFERDQLEILAGVDLDRRWRTLEPHLDLLLQRDDATIELAHLHLDLDRPEEARRLLTDREFQPWEGGEGKVLGAWDRAHLVLAHRARVAGDPHRAIALIDAALHVPTALGEQRHPLAANAALFLARGDARSASGDGRGAQADWRRAAEVSGDFLDMRPEPYSEATYASVTALRRLGEHAEAERATEGLARYGESLATAPAAVDYFATSLPSLLLFTRDLAIVRARRTSFLRAQVAHLRGDDAEAGRRIVALLAEDPAHHAARDLAREHALSEASS